MNGNANAHALRRVLEAHCAGPVVAPEPAAAPARTAPRGPAGRGGQGDGRQRAVTAIPNGLAVQVLYRSEHAQGEMRLSDEWRVKPTDELLAALRSEFAGSTIEIVY
jgi:DNA polymerase-3 subunit alpha